MSRRVGGRREGEGREEWGRNMEGVERDLRREESRGGREWRRKLK